MAAWLKWGWWRYLIMLAGLVITPLVYPGNHKPDVLTLEPTVERAWLVNSLGYYRDATHSLSFDDIRAAERRGEFHSVTGMAVPIGSVSVEPIWIHFAVRYPADCSAIWWLLLTPDILPTITLYAEQADGRFAIHHGGNALPFRQREMPGVGHAFKLGQGPSGIRHYFIHVTAAFSARIEPSLWQENPLIEYLGRYRGTLGVYVGMISVLGVMALVRALRYRRPLDIAYFLYLLGFELFNLGHNGFLQISGLVDSLVIRKALIQIGLFLTGFSFLSVTRTLIVWPRRSSVWPDRLLSMAIAITLVIILMASIASSPYLLLEINLNQAVIWVLISGLMGLWAAWRGYPNARLFAVCFLPFVFWSSSMSVMRWLDTPLPDTFTRYRILMITSSIHLFTLWYLILSKDARLERAKRELELQLSGLRSEMSHMSLFMGMLGHELNRPLNALAALAQPDPPAVSAAPAVTDSTRRQQLSAIHGEFSGILDTCMERMRQAAVTQLDIKSVDLGGLIQGVTEHFQLKTTTHLIRSHAQGLPAEFPCDPKLISILLINLVENAIRHSPAGGMVWVGGKRMDADTVEISVTDEGPGIPASDQERIFERYIQLQPESTGKQGMGLGLFIVRRIAEMHGGSVVCESALGEGASFRVTLQRGQAGA